MPNHKTSSFPKKFIIGLVSILLIAAYGYRSYTGSHQAAPPMGDAAAVSVASVIERTVTKWDEFSGILTAVEQVDIRPRVAGTIEAIHFAEGQLVNKGQKLFTIDPRPYQVAVAKTLAALSAAKAQAAYAQAEFKRSKELLAQKVISTHEFDAAQEQYSSAEANINIAEAAHQQALLNLEYTTITAPVAGRVSRAFITTGNLVDGGGDAPILTRIVSIDPVYVDFDADEQTFIRYLNTHNNNPEKLKTIKVLLGLAGGHDFPYQGVIQSFDNSLNSSAGTIHVRAVFSNPTASLVPGLFARIRMSGTGADKAVLITERAIGTDQDKKFVLVVGADNKTSYREVVPGAVIDNLRVIDKGLKAGEKIIVNGLQRTRPGATIVPEMVPMDNPSPTADAPEAGK